MFESPFYKFELPSEEDVIERNKTITSYYAKLYKSEPNLYKWAGMAAFASFHIGEKLKLWDWKESGIKSFPETCLKKNRTFEDDIQIIRIINNRIFLEIGKLHLDFIQLDYKVFNSKLMAANKHPIIVEAFENLHLAQKTDDSKVAEKLVWEANTAILYHEQHYVVQPMFDKLTQTFSFAMSLIASFDYRVNHKKTNWQLPSRFLLFILRRGLLVVFKNDYLPDITNFNQRWFWISKDLLKKWKRIENKRTYVNTELNYLIKKKLTMK